MSDTLDLLYLFNQSDRHLQYSLAEFNSYALFPHLAGNSILLREDGMPVGLFNWAYLTPIEGDIFLQGQFSWPMEVFEREPSDDFDMWAIEFIAPFGHAAKLRKEIRTQLKSKYGPCGGYFRRYKDPTKKRKWIAL